MGLFNRKSSKLSNESKSNPPSSPRVPNAPLKSPAPSRLTNGGTFSTLSLTDVTLPRPPDPNVDPAAYLRSIYAVRERCRYIFEKAKRHQLSHFEVDMSLFSKTAEYVVAIIKVRSAGILDCPDVAKILLLERLCAGLPFHPPAWPMAAL